MPLLVLIKTGLRAQHRKPEAPCLAGVETSARGRFLGVVALEGLEFQTGTFFQATEGGFLDDTVASGIDVVHAAADFVVATDLDFLGRIGSSLVLAGPFVLEGFLTFDPRASESAFHDLSFIVALGACDRASGGLAGIDGAFADDVIFGVSVTIVQTFAIGHATGSLGRNLLATGAGAVEPTFASFEGVSDVVLLTIFNATSGHQTGTIVDGFIADEGEFVLGDFFVQGDTFALIDAARVDATQIVVIALFAGVEVAAVFPLGIDLVFGTLVEASDWLQSQQTVTAQGALKAESFLVGRATDFDVFQVFGQTAFRHNITIAAFVEETTAFQLGAI